MKMLAGATAGSSSSAFLFRGNDDNGEPVIPGEQRETRNPGGIIAGSHLLPLDATFAGMTDGSVSVVVAHMLSA